VAEKREPGSGAHLRHDPLGARVGGLGAAAAVREGEPGVGGGDCCRNGGSTGPSRRSRPGQGGYEESPPVNSHRSMGSPHLTAD
jgi:hypothetical protein